MRSLYLFLSASLGVIASSSLAHAQIVTDGSLGASMSIPGGSGYSIDAALGQQRGVNLFHSFSTFNVGTGQTASFASPGSVENIIARVTGGSSSTINGTLIANANLFLLNPNGVLFGANAVLNVNGSFHASTADYLKLADGARFYTNLSSTSVLAVAAPTAFGFLDSSVAPIVAQNGYLSVPATRSFSLIGGHITLSNAQLSVSAGRLNIAAVTSPGEVTLGSNSLTLSGFTTLGDIQFNQGLVNVDTEEAASVYIRGGRFVMENSSAIFGGTTIAGPTRTIDIDVDSLQLKASGIVTGATLSGAGTNTTIRARQIDVSDGSAVLITAAGSNAGGDISIRADDFRLSGNLSLVGTGAAMGSGRAGNVSIQATTVTVADGAISAVSGSGGAAGNIDLAADTVTLSRGGGITSGASASGSGGRITIRARELVVDGTAGTLPTAISAVTTGGASNSGNAGAIAIDVDSLTLRRGNISTSTGGPGSGGDIDINARSVAMENNASITSETGTATSTTSPPSFGRGGSIAITSQSMAVNSGSKVSASTFGSGGGGTITINSNQLSVDSKGSPGVTGVLVNTGSATNSSAAGAGGNVVLRTGDLSLLNQGVIGANTYGRGTAGRIDILGERVALSGAASISASSFGLAPNAGAANDIVIAVNQLDVASGAQVANNTLGTGAAGRLLITSKSLNVTSGGSLQASSLSSAPNPGAAGDIFINTDTATIDNAGINARSFGTAQPGGIVLNARRVTLDNGAVLSATGVGAGNAGNIIIGATDSLALYRGSRIVTEALNGSGGNIRLFANDRIELRESLLSTSVLGASANGGNISIDPIFVIVDNSQIIARAVGGSGGNINISTQYLFQSANSAIDASSQVGINGHVEIFGADVNLNADIAALPTDFLNARQWLASACARRLGGDVSQFSVNGRDGVYQSTFDLIASPLLLGSSDASTVRTANSDRRIENWQVQPLLFQPACLREPG